AIAGRAAARRHRAGHRSYCHATCRRRKSSRSRALSDEPARRRPDDGCAVGSDAQAAQGAEYQAGFTEEVTRSRALFVRQWNEFDFVARHLVKMAGLPVRLGLLDAFLAGRYEIPPDVTRAIHRRTAEDDEMSIVDCGDGYRVAGLENQQPSRLEPVASDIDDAFDDVDCALLMGRVSRQRRALLQMHIAEYRLVHRRHRR